MPTQNRAHSDLFHQFESREADLAGHIGNPSGGTEVRSSVEDSYRAASEPNSSASEPEKEKEEDLISLRRDPNPAKDAQLRAALDLVKDPAKWQKSLGEAAKKPAPKKDDSGKENKSE